MLTRLERAIEWIAVNDEPYETEVAIIKDQITVVLIADLWERKPRDIALMVVKKRREINIMITV